MKNETDPDPTPQQPNWSASDFAELSQPPVVVPAELLSEETLASLIEEFVTRHGTELSEAADKVLHVRALLKCGKARIMFDPNSQTCNIESVV